LSEFKQWSQKSHSKRWLLFPENIGVSLSIDETALSNGELYTILTNKKAKGKKGAIVAMVKGTKSEDVIAVLNKIPLNKRNKVTEITLDMAGSMELIAKISFPKSSLVTDRFHVQKLATEAVQEIRIKYRWEALDKDNESIEIAKHNGITYKAEILSNGDTIKQLLARSRFLLFKHYSKWTDNQKERADILFELFPDIRKAYELLQKLSYIYQNTSAKSIALTKLARWYDEVEKANFKSFNTISRTIQLHYRTILNYFDNRSTNASAESFNAKIKAFRSQFRGVRDIPFFLFRLTKIFA
jgi:transposase